MRTLDQEKIETNLAANVEDKTKIDGRTAAAFGGEVPGIDQKAGGEDECECAGVDGQHQDTDRVELLEVADLKCFDTRD